MGLTLKITNTKVVGREKKMLAEFIRELNLISFLITPVFHICAIYFIRDIVRIVVAFIRDIVHIVVAFIRDIVRIVVAFNK
jgi:hypothetical protein